MSTKYNHGDRVPTDVLVKRLHELAEAVTQGESGIKREFYMRIPAELDHDADLVISEVAMRLEKLEAIAATLIENSRKHNFGLSVVRQSDIERLIAEVHPIADQEAA